MNLPPDWAEEELEAERQRAEEHFREARHTEPLEVYLELFDEYQGIVEELMEETVDLTRLDECAEELLSNPQKREVFRYLSGPPVSEDDLKVLVKARSIAPRTLSQDSAVLARLIDFIRDWHDRRRFPWVSPPGWQPQEHERNAAVVATTALLAMRRVETLRRNEGGQLQEQKVETQLLRGGFRKVPTRKVRTLSEAPKPGEFCRESYLGERKADFILGLWDGRTMGVECKVSNSSTNSVKRLNNDAAVKAEAWRQDFGKLQIVPAAVLSGVYRLHNLQNAQQRGLSLFWAHDLQALTNWIRSTAGT